MGRFRLSSTFITNRTDSLVPPTHEPFLKRLGDYSARASDESSSWKGMTPGPRRESLKLRIQIPTPSSSA